MFRAALSLWRQGDDEGALRACRALLEKRPKHARAWALCALLENDLASAERGFELRPDLSATRSALAQLLTRVDARQVPRTSTALLERAAVLTPDDVGARFRLGRAARKLKMKELAAREFRAVLALDPTHALAEFWLATLDATVVSRAPPQHVKSLYEGYAARYDDHLATLKSRTPALVADILRGVDATKGIDLGCGTGLSGTELKRVLDVQWTGVDLSSAMCALAAGRGVYERVETRDLLSIDSVYDCFAASDVLCYFGDLAPVFQATRRACKSKAHFAFSLEEEDGDSWHLAESGRFRHGMSYVVQVAAKHGWVLKEARQATLRLQAGIPVPGRIYLFITEES